MAGSTATTHAKGVVTRSTKALSALGLIAGVILAVLVNVFAARHYQRWDITSSKLYTLSPATVETLRGLEQNVQVEVLLSRSDPLELSVRTLLQAYGAETTRLEVRYTDPDRHPAEFVAAQQKYGIVAGRTEDGRVVTDASIVVASRDRHWFVTSSEMVDFGRDADARPRSKIERALTAAIRAVLGGERLRICFSAGHGEYLVEDHSAQGLSELRSRLEKDNYEVISVDSSKPDNPEPYKSCAVLVVAGPSRPFSPEEVERIQRRMNEGMGGFFLLNPLFDPERKVQLATGLEPVMRVFGVGVAQDYVFERDDAARVPRGTGEVFFAESKSHPTTEGLLSASASGLRVV